MAKKEPRVWRVWVDPKRRIVSFHPEAGFELLEFREQEMFLRCLDEYTRNRFRYQ